MKEEYKAKTKYLNVLQKFLNYFQYSFHFIGEYHCCIWHNFLKESFFRFLQLQQLPLINFNWASSGFRCNRGKNIIIHRSFHSKYQDLGTSLKSCMWELKKNDLVLWQLISEALENWGLFLLAGFWHLLVRYYLTASKSSIRDQSKFNILIMALLHQNTWGKFSNWLIKSMWKTWKTCEIMKRLQKKKETLKSYYAICQVLFDQHCLWTTVKEYLPPEKRLSRLSKKGSQVLKLQRTELS